MKIIAILVARYSYAFVFPYTVHNLNCCYQTKLMLENYIIFLNSDAVCAKNKIK